MPRPHRPAPRVLGALLTVALAEALSACGDEGARPPPPVASAEQASREVGAGATSLAGKPKLDLAEGLDLPEVGTIGDLPPAATRVVMRIDRDGELYVDGVPTAEADLARRARKPGRGGGQTDVLLAIDRSVPWAATVRLLSFAASGLGTVRVQFLVAPEGGGAPGALATFLPGSHDSCCGPQADADPVRVTVGLADGPPTDPGALFAALRALPVASRDLRVGLPVRALVPTGEALRVVDVVFRAGYSWVGFHVVDGDDAKGTIRELVARARAAKGSVRLSLNDEVLSSPPASASPLPVVARVVGRPAGDWGPIEPTPAGKVAAEEDVPINSAEIEEVEQGREPNAVPAPPRPPLSLHVSPKRPREMNEDPVGFALGWLALHQSPDGRFEAQGFAGWCRGEPWTGTRPGGAGLSTRDVETTSLALLVFQGAGWSRRSEGPNGTAVRGALSWLVARQDEEGCLSDRSDPLFLRDHAIATLALAMADRASGGASTTRLPLVRALAFATSARRPGGGWGRGVHSGELDLVTTAWMAAVWNAARSASADAVDAKRDPVPLDAAVLAEAREAVLAVTDPRTGRVLGAPADPRLDALSPAAWMVRRLAGEDPKGEPLASASARLVDALPTREAGRAFDPLVVWFGTLVAYERDGDLWKAWELALKDAVDATQDTAGNPCEAGGSWDPVGPSVSESGRVAATALLALVCEVYYRYDRVPGLAPTR